MKYKHKKKYHNLKAPSIIVPEIIRLLNPKSVIDIGCGTGTFLHVFKKLGVTEVLGIDGPWANKKLLFENINEADFLEHDLEQKIKLPKTYDVAISLEVAEHLSEKSSDVFVESLVNASKLVVFSAAIPYQGGQNHINEQWITYWEEKFANHNYILHDVFRPLFWDNPEVFSYYKNNMYLFAPKEKKFDFEYASIPTKKVVHYDMYHFKAKYVDDVVRGTFSPFLYLKWLILSIFGFSFISKMKRFFNW